MNRKELLQQYIKEDPNDPFNIYALALECKNNNLAEAEKLFQLLLAEHPNYLATYYQAANLFWQTGQLAKAKKTYLKGISVAENQKEFKTLAELRSNLSEFIFETED